MGDHITGNLPVKLGSEEQGICQRRRLVKSHVKRHDEFSREWELRNSTQARQVSGNITHPASHRGLQMCVAGQ
jgi:hypothetical protein